jgi:hypothetical protein
MADDGGPGSSSAASSPDQAAPGPPKLADDGGRPRSPNCFGGRRSGPGSSAATLARRAAINQVLRREPNFLPPCLADAKLNAQSLRKLSVVITTLLVVITTPVRPCSCRTGALLLARVAVLQHRHQNDTNGNTSPHGGRGVMVGLPLRSPSGGLERAPHPNQTLDPGCLPREGGIAPKSFV